MDDEQLWGGTLSEAAATLAARLRTKCGCWASGSSPHPGHPTRALLSAASGAAKRHLALLKNIGMPLVVIPFNELIGVDGEGSAAAGGCRSATAVAYVEAVLQEHCQL